MTPRLLACAGLVATLALAPASALAADSAKNVVIGPNDTFAFGTHVVCISEVSKTVVPGQRVVSCSYASSRGPVPRTYAAALSAAGEAVLTKVRPDRSSAVVVRRRLSLARGRATPYRVAVGDFVSVKGTPIACVVAKSSVKGDAAASVICFLYDKTRNRIRPSSYGVRISDSSATVFRYDAAGHVKVVRVVLQPKV